MTSGVHTYQHMTASTLERVRQVQALMANGMGQERACAQVGIARGSFHRAVRSLAGGATVGTMGRAPLPLRYVAPPPGAPAVPYHRRPIHTVYLRLYSRWKVRARARPAWALVPPPRYRNGRLVLNPALLSLLKDDERRGLFPAKGATL